MLRARFLAAATLGLLLAPALSARANLLRNAAFQDDWITLLPENQNHHWCYATAFVNRRDYNPDGWACSGSWNWLNPDAPAGSRHFVMRGPKSQVFQRVNWVLVHDDRRREGFPDAGGFPAHAPQRSLAPLTLVRDLRLRLHVRGDAVPPDAASVELGLAPPGGISASDPLGSRVPFTASVRAALPSGTFGWLWVELTLPAARWLEAATEAASRNPKEATESKTLGLILPGTAGLALRYEAASGHIEIERVELTAPGPATPNLLTNGGFETLDATGHAAGWSTPSKYIYFPPALYYLFNTWHNTTAENRGLVAADALLAHSGNESLKMIVPAGDELQVSSTPIALAQEQPRLIEVSAWVKTDRLNLLQIDAVSETGERLDGFNFIHKAPVSIGTDEWRQIRQVFRPRRLLRSVKIQLCARGVNGYTLDDTGAQAQGNATGTVWWDDIRVFEPESTLADLSARRVVIAGDAGAGTTRPRLADLDPGERMAGRNVLTATLTNPGTRKSFTLVWQFTSPEGARTEARSASQAVEAGASEVFSIPYDLPAAPLDAYTEYKGTLGIVDATGQNLARSELWFSTWSTPIDIELGALYLQPDQTQFVRMNLGLSSAAMSSVALVKLEVVRRGTGAILRSINVKATAEAIRARRDRIPRGLREDFTNLVLADLDVSFLPVQPFASPERNWLVRATIVDQAGHSVASADSAPFCRLGHDSPQAPVRSVRIDRHNLLYVNDQPFLPWGATYGHVPVYEGPAEAGAVRDLHNLPAWSIYDGFTASGYGRASADFNTLRYVSGSVTPQPKLEKAWTADNILAATAFVAKAPVFSPEELAASAGGATALAQNLAFIKSAPMVVSVAPGIEEAFGLFRSATSAQLEGLGRVVESLRRETGKPVMVGHGGYWNRFEFERVPFFDIYDPETEPLYPAPLHTDLMPLLAGQEKTIWLRPQMYEDVPYERWRFHAFVELMRGARGWQMAHGPGDASLFRGLHAELEMLKAVAWSTTPGPETHVDPPLEHWTRRQAGKTYVIAATTRGLTFGKWRWQAGPLGPGGRARVTEGATAVRDESNAYGIGELPVAGPALHGIQYLPDARRHTGASRLVQWVRLDPAAPPHNVVILAKGDGRFTHAAAWGPFDPAANRRNPSFLAWFLRSFYRHASGFLGWGAESLGSALEFLPERAAPMGDLPRPGEWTKLEVRLSDLGAGDLLLDGAGFMHDGGRVEWGRTSIVMPSGVETLLFGDDLLPAPERLARTRLWVAGLKAGTRVRVLFEDREIVSEAGFFVDDFRGRDLYQRFGGGPGTGYGGAPVALHIYEIP